MSLFEQHRSAPFGAETIYQITLAFDAVINAVKAKLVADRTYRELSRLSASQLRDIGLGESDLVDFCRNAAKKHR